MFPALIYHLLGRKDQPQQTVVGNHGWKQRHQKYRTNHLGGGSSASAKIGKINIKEAFVLLIGFTDTRYRHVLKSGHHLLSPNARSDALTNTHFMGHLLGPH